MFLPVTAQMIVSITEIVPKIVSVPEIVRVSQVVSIPETVRVPSYIISIRELGSGVSLVPNARDDWIFSIRDWRDTIALWDTCYRVWTGTRDRRSINRPPVRERW